MERASPPDRAATRQLLAFAVLVGLLAAATTGYRYGLGVPVVHLPEILRTLDAGYLVNDFWLNAQEGFGPRFYFRLAIAAAASVVPLWLVYAAAFVLAVVALSVATALASRDLAGSAVAAVVAVPLVMWTVPFELAGWPAIRGASGGGTVVSPLLLAEPLCFLALWRGIRGRPMQAAAISVPAMLLHPTFGLATAAVALAAALAHLERGPAEGAPAKGRGTWALAAGAGIVAAATLGFWILPGLLSGAIFALEASEVVRLVAQVRHPHHLLPSTWPAEGFLRLAAFWAAGALALAGWRGRSRSVELAPEDARTVRAIAVVFVAVAGGLACGWFFVEVMPSRWAAMAYLFRLQALMAWLCWIVLAATVADGLRALWLRVPPRWPTPAPRLAAWLRGPGLHWAGLLGLATVLAAVAGSVALLRTEAPPAPALAVRVARWLDVPQPVFTLREARLRARPAEAALAAAARTATPPDAVFLIPEEWRHWRLHAHRAVVADWKAFPFRERQMRAWHDRYLDVFDLEQGIGYPVRATERWLRVLATRYRIDYAVVPRSSCLRWPTVALSGRWKLVAVAR